MTGKGNSLRWWQKAVIYQIYPRSFKDTSGNGIGDLKGVIEQLDYLNDGTGKSLGVDAIWISPFYPSPMADFGYDVADYCDVNPLFGELETIDSLIAEAHRRGIRVIIDYVPNHSSDQHPWFLESRRSQDNPKRNWYIWRDSKPDGSFPNNWGSAFGGPAWTWDEITGQYYFHQFLKEQPDLNWRNPEVKAAMMEVLRFWMERGVDGFRMDVVGMILKDPAMRDNPPNPHAPPNLPPSDIFNFQSNIHNQDQDEVFENLREFRRLLDEYGDRCAIGEIWYDLPRWVRYYGENGDGLHLPFNFRLINQPWEAAAIRQSVDEFEAALPPFAWPNYVLGNHDVSRIVSRVGEAQVRIAAMLLLSLRGTPTLYYADELGLPNGVIPVKKMQDPPGLRFGLERSRDVARTPMQWDDSPFAGFSTVEPWLPVSPDYHTRNVSLQDDDPGSILNLYRHLIWYRRKSPSLLAGSYRAVHAPANCFVYVREHSSGTHLVALNFSPQERGISIPADSPGKLLISTYLDRVESLQHPNVHLRPNEGVLIKITS